MFITVGVRRLFALFGLFWGLFKFSFRLVLGCSSLGFGLRYVFFNSSFTSFPDLLYMFSVLLVQVIILRETMDEVIAKRGDNVGD